MDEELREEIDGLLRAVVVAVEGALPEQDIRSAWELLDAGEPGVALETLCTQLYEYDVPVSPDVIEMLAAAGRRMGMRESLWEILTVSRPGGA